MVKETLKEKIATLVQTKLSENEEVQGFFIAQYKPSIAWFLVVGPLYAAGMRQYYIAATDKGMHFHKLNVWGRPDTWDFLAYDEIERLSVGKGLMTCKLTFKFKNGRKLAVNALVKGHKNIPKFEDNLLSHIQGRIGKKA